LPPAAEGLEGQDSMTKSLNLDAQLAAVAARLVERRESVLARWRAAVAADVQVTAADSLSRAQFIDHIPQILEGLCAALCAGQADAVDAATVSAQTGGGHGMHRWQQGYSLIELMREWSHLHLALIAEMQHFTEEHPGLDVRAINSAYRTIAMLCLEGMNKSAAEFERMQRAEAAGQVNDLGLQLRTAREVERRQAEILRGAAHDLHGNMGILSNAATALTLDNVPNERRAELFAMAQRAIGAHTRLLSDLMDLARLQAGYEQPRIAVTDVSQLLRELCELAVPIAAGRNLYLHFEGPPQLLVEADGMKVGRIVQNLLLNALHYTQHGGVTVIWGDSQDNDPKRWRVSVEDTGPGIQRGAAAPLADALEEATDEAREVEGVTVDKWDDVAASHSRSGAPVEPARHGEGIGLSIVKRLCELLDATLEMQSVAGSGTTFSVVFPRRYLRD
jgi:signal transduction histidine kinase